MRPRTVILTLLLLVASAAPAVGTAGVSPAEPTKPDRADTTRVTPAERDIELASTLRLTPDRPGEITVNVRFTVPERVSSLRTNFSSNVQVVSTNGFSRSHDGTNVFEWDGETESATLTYRVDANRTTGSGGFSVAGTTRETDASRRRTAETATTRSDNLLFADTGSWALVTTPNPAVDWRYTGNPPALNRTTTVAGEGTVGDRITFLGSHEVHTRRANGQTFRLVVPAAADMAEDPEAVLDSLTYASGALRVGDRDSTVFFVAAPAGPDWAVRGIQAGDADAWVRAEERLDTPDSPWIHEYVHTRQGFEKTRSTWWFIEGSADYYAALFTLRQGHIDFDEFAADLARGEREPYADGVLANPSTWAAGTQYLKGGLVAGELDRRTRLATDAGATLASVLARLNARKGPVTNADFLRAVEAVAGKPVADLAERYTRTDAAPAMWQQSAHNEAFGKLPAHMEFTRPSRPVVNGPYRNGTTPPPVSLVPGETLTVRTTAENVGDSSGEFVVTLEVDNEVTATTNGRLAAGERTTVSLSHTFEKPGVYTVTVVGQSYQVRVSKPASPSVGSVEVNRTTAGTNEAVLVTATVENEADVPAVGEVPVSVDDAHLRTETVELAPGESRELSVVVRFSEAGEHRVSFAGETVSLRVGSTTGTAAATSESGLAVNTNVAPLTVVSTTAVLLALSLTLLFARRVGRG